MGREEKRKQKKRLKTKMTSKQLQKLEGELIEEKVKDYLDNTWDKFSEVLIQVMRKHNISQERTSLIIKELSEEIVRLYGEGKNA